jgi:superfamily II DNA or RNA helicase
VGPTGCGKTVIAAKLLSKCTEFRRVLFLAHRFELIDQAHGRLADIGIKAGVIMASDEARGNDRVRVGARVQVASVQTVSRRGLSWSPDLIIIDEAHRTMADSYQRIAALYPQARVLGLTATPERLDGKGLADFYEDMYEIAKPSELYARKYLVKPAVYSAPPGVAAEIVKSLKSVRTRAGEYAQDEAGEAMGRTKLIGHLVREAKRLAPGVPKVLFACTVKHSLHCTKRLTRAGIKTVHIDGNTPADDRDMAIADLAAGRIECISNVDVLGEGWDLPNLGAVIIARPTKSRVRLLQMAGRVQRPYKGKAPIVIDHAANILRLDTLPGADRAWLLNPSEEGGESTGPAVRVCKECHACIPAGCTACPHCGAALSRYLTEKEEQDAKLVEYNEERMFSIRTTIGKMGPGEWADTITRALM